MTVELSRSLDPTVDYGPDGLDGVVQSVEAGKYRLEEGETRPVIKNALTGELVKGTGQPRQEGRKDVVALGKELRDVFSSKLAANFDSIVDSLIEIAVVKKDVRAHKLLLEHGLGRPKEMAQASSPWVEQFLRLMQQGYSAEALPPPNVVEGTAREVD